MGKTLLEFQPNKGDVLPSHKVRMLFFPLNRLFWEFGFFMEVSSLSPFLIKRSLDVVVSMVLDSRKSCTR